MMTQSIRIALPFVLVLLSTIATVTAQSSLEALFNPQMGQLSPTTSLSSRIDSQADTKRQGKDLAIVHYGFDMMTPLHQDENSELALTTGLSLLDIATTARLTDADADLTDHLWQPYFGGFYRKVLDEGKMAGAFLEISSPSDKPFDSIHEIAVNASAFFRVPAQDQNAWYYFLNFSNNREFLNNIPIPGLGYFQQHRPSLQTMLGAPLSSLRWTPSEKLTAEAIYMFLRTIHLKVTYECSQRLKIYSGFDWQNQSYLRAGRSDHDDRLFYYEKRILAGIDLAVTENIRLDIHGGYSFDRFFFEGEDYDDRDENRISLTDGPFAAITTHLRF